MIVQRGICIQTGPRPTSPSVVTSKDQAQSTANHVNVIHTMHGRKIAPGSSCGPLDSCGGGSMCVDGLCVCSAGMKPSVNDLCEPVTTSKPSKSSVSVPNRGHDNISSMSQITKQSHITIARRDIKESYRAAADAT
ncbi:hypothetical protein KIN20_029722 [Parelaphostrongylus tenuis]|uniref:EB domain-containing protein n=1 Tax=Parelaphostrongylus tenuis TaxID=148309 RepID=A0AAD5R303_PARTN|nr:hypothetical protein KIN20_029722 [Parelaphostrongylus tenuis]